MKKIYYGKAVYNNKEINAVLNVLKNDMIRALIEQVLDYEKRTGERVKRERWFTL